MVVPIDLLKPILDDLQTIGRANRPPRPWLGIYATEVGSNVAILGLASRGPAQRSDLRAGDVVLGVGGSSVKDLAGLFRRVWALGQAGVEVPLLINREGKSLLAAVTEDKRLKFMPIEVAGTDGKVIRIASGISEGVRVALNVPNTISDGAKVNPAPPTPAPAAPPAAPPAAAPPPASSAPASTPVKPSTSAPR